MRRIIVGISGASGAIYGVKLLQALKASQGVETHLVISHYGKKTIGIETPYTVAEVEGLADAVYPDNDMTSRLASGSFMADTMIVAPCSIKTLSGIANSYADNLLVRAADVTLKECRKLILAVRETPLHRGHIDLMQKAASIGAIIAPPMVACYQKPQTVDEVINHGVGKLLDLAGIEHNLYKRWEGVGG